jgi:hypothetical protein
MTIGDTVSVWPLGKPELAEAGKLLILSGNSRSAAVAFDELPQFLAQAVRETDGKIAIDKRGGGIFNDAQSRGRGALSVGNGEPERRALKRF